jgi:hypothetical protein
MKLLKRIRTICLGLYLVMRGQPEAPKPARRICARCGKPILKHHRWSAKAWLDDPRPRHWDCDYPTGEGHGKNTEVVEVIRGIEEIPTASAPETLETLCEADSSQASEAEGAEDSNSPSWSGDAESSPGGLGEGRETVRCVPEAVASGWRPVPPNAPGTYPE